MSKNISELEEETLLNPPESTEDKLEDKSESEKQKTKKKKVAEKDSDHDSSDGSGDDDDDEDNKYIKRIGKGSIPEILKKLECDVCAKNDFKSFESLVKHSKVCINPFYLKNYHLTDCICILLLRIIVVTRMWLNVNDANYL